MPKPRPSVWIIDPAINTPEIDIFNYWNGRSPINLKYITPISQGFSPIDEGFRHSPPQGIIVMGSDGSVNDSSEWIKQLSDRMETWLQHELPLMAICFGHQLLAKILGANIIFARPNQTQIKEFTPIKVTRPDWLLGAPTTSGKLLSVHREQVCFPAGQLTSDWVIAASTDQVPVQAFFHRRKKIFSLQSHPEATLSFAQKNNIPIPDIKELNYGHQLVADFIDTCHRGGH
jgi:GMP synthase-like glutamine amidotransferase